MTAGAKLLASLLTLAGALIVVMVLVASCGDGHPQKRTQTACTAHGQWDSGDNVYLRRPPLCP